MPSDRGRPAAPSKPVSALLLTLIVGSLAAPLIGAMLTRGHVGPLFVVDWTPTMARIDWSATGAIVLALLVIAEGARDRTSRGWARAARVVRTMTWRPARHGRR